VEITLSALVVAIPEAEPRVGALRTALDPSAALGVPAHVTICFRSCRRRTSTTAC
jgi:hypothetical protein